MMRKLGYVPGTTLGKVEKGEGKGEGKGENGNGGRGIREPIFIEVREGRGGVGLGKRKRGFGELESGGEGEEGVREYGEGEKGGDGEGKERDEAEDFRQRVSREREDRRIEALVRGAMVVLEGLEEEGDADGNGRRGGGKVDVLYRGLIRERAEREREKREQNGLTDRLGKGSGYGDGREGYRPGGLHLREVLDEGEGEGGEGEGVEVEIEGGDEELDIFEKLEGRERLRRVVGRLRERWWYCFWCKWRYESEGMEGCPGVEEEDHD